MDERNTKTPVVSFFKKKKLLFFQPLYWNGRVFCLPGIINVKGMFIVSQDTTKGYKIIVVAIDILKERVCNCNTVTSKRLETVKGDSPLWILV